MKTIGIVAHSAEGGALCFLTACRAGAEPLGPHMHPEIVVSAIPMGLSMPAWDADDHATVAALLARGVQQVAAAGADFFVCPDNTAHLALETVAEELPIPGLHIAEVVCREAVAHGWRRVGLLGTSWTMTGAVYERALAAHGLERLIPDEATRERLHAVIFDELCQGALGPENGAPFLAAIDALRERGADCCVLGCTEIPLVVTPEEATLPTLDSTRLLAQAAVDEALDGRPLPVTSGWIRR